MNNFASIYIFIVWIVIWVYFGKNDTNRNQKREGGEVLDKNDGISKGPILESIQESVCESVHVAPVRVLSPNKRLKFYSGTLFVLLTLFYTIPFLPFAFELGYFELQLGALTFLPYVIVLFGAFLMISSRRELGDLQAYDIFFSINPTRVHKGVYKYMNHPMYFGIFCITLSSLVLFPTIIGGLMVLGVYYCIYMKSKIEL